MNSFFQFLKLVIKIQCSKKEQKNMYIQLVDIAPAPLHNNYLKLAKIKFF